MIRRPGLSSALGAVFLLLTLCLPALAPADGTEQTHQTVPSANFSFISDLQNYLKREDANRFADLSPSVIVQGGLHSTVASLTATPSEMTAYISGFYVTEDASITYPNNSTCWVIAHKTMTGDQGDFTRQSNTHYLLNCAATSQPEPPADSVYMMKVTTSGGSVTAVEDYRALGGKGINACASYASLEDAVDAIGSTPQVLVIANCTFPLTTNKTVPTTLELTVRDSGRLCVGSGVTATINSTFHAPIRTVFPCAGEVQFASTSRTVVIPDWYGAKGDNTGNYQGQLNDALYSGRPVFIPCGTYRSGGALTYRNSNQAIYGAGDCSIIYFTNPAANGFIPSGTLSNVQFRDFQIWGGATDDSTIHICIYTDISNIVTESVVSNVTFAGPNATTGCNVGVKMEQDSHRWRVAGNRFKTILKDTANHGYGVLVGKSFFHTIVNNLFTGTVNYGRHAVYLTAAASNNLVANNTILDYNSSAIVINTSTAQGTSVGNLIANNKVVSGGDLANTDLGGIEIDGNGEDNMIVGNHIYGYDANGIVVTDAGEGGHQDRPYILDNYIFGVDFHGIRVCGTKGAVIQGNNIVNASVASPNTYDGLNLTSSCSFGTEVLTDTKVSGNTVTGTAHHHAFHIDTTNPDPTGTILGFNTFGPGNVGTITFGDASIVGPKVFTSLNQVKGIAIGDTNANNLASDCSFSAATTCAVAFPTAEPDTNYRILLGCNGNKTFWWSSRATTGFTINASSSSSDNCSWAIIRDATQ